MQLSKGEPRLSSYRVVFQERRVALSRNAAFHNDRRGVTWNCSSAVCFIQNLPKIQCRQVLHKVHVFHYLHDFRLGCFHSLLPSPATKCLEFNVSIWHDSSTAINLNPSALKRAPTSVLTNVSWILGIKFTVRGEKNLREQKSCVVVSNHQSSLDILGERSEKTLITITTPIPYLIRKRSWLPINFGFIWQFQRCLVRKPT